MRDAPYRNAAAFRNGVETRIKAEARASSLRSVEQVRRQFLLQRFLVRIFAEPDGRWVLKGGTGLIVRIPGARHSNDITCSTQYPTHCWTMRWLICAG